MFPPLNCCDIDARLAPRPKAGDRHAEPGGPRCLHRPCRQFPEVDLEQFHRNRRGEEERQHQQPVIHGKRHGVEERLLRNGTYTTISTSRKDTPTAHTIQRLENTPMENMLWYSERAVNARISSELHKGNESDGLGCHQLIRDSAAGPDRRPREWRVRRPLPTTPIPIAISRLMTGSVGERDGCFMMSGSPFSRPSARAGAPSLTRFSQSSCNRPQGYRHAHQHRREDNEDFPDVAGEQEVDELADVGIDDPALLYGGDDAGKIVVRQDHVRSLLGHVRAGDAHGDADVRPLQRRRVVDAVAGHRHHVAARLQGHRRSWSCAAGKPGSTLRACRSWP